MAFPLSPIDKQTYINSLGTTFKYDSTREVWLIYSQEILGNTGIQGLTGILGLQGITGLVGITGLGFTGLQGVQGLTGLIGNTGSQGQTGLIGDTGIEGQTGLIGSTGNQGITGLIGDTGVEGQTGLIGSTGIQGGTGLVGSTGIQGNTGCKGDTGVVGTTGIQGYTGVAGRTGIQGQTGLIGGTGVQGQTGLIGSTGVQGLTGLIGQTGLFGRTGIQGQTGLIGSTGIQGNTGVQGITGLIGGTGVQGQTGLIGSTGVQGLTGLIGSTGIQGYTGVAGGTGVQGITGLIGNTGVQGLTGLFDQALFNTRSGNNVSAQSSLPTFQFGKDSVTRLYGYVVNNSSDTTLYNDFLRWDLSVLLPGSGILDASAVFYCDATGTDSSVINVHRMTRSVDYVNANWNTYDGTNTWTTSGGDYDSTVLASWTYAVGSRIVTFNSDGIDVLQGMINGTLPNYGFINVGHPYSYTGRYRGFLNSDTANRPKLSINYVPAVWGVTGLRGLTGLVGGTGLIGGTGIQGVTGIQGLTGLQGNSVTGIQGSTGVGTVASTISRLWSLSLPTQAPSAVGKFSKAGYTNLPTTDPSNPGINNAQIDPYLTLADCTIVRASFSWANCAVSQGTVGNPTMAMDVYKANYSTRTLLGTITVPVDRTKCSVSNSLGNDNFQASTVTGLSIVMPAGTLWGLQFTNSAVDNSHINALGYCYGSVETRE